MKIYAKPQYGLSRAMDRVYQAMQDHCGKHTFTDDLGAAELVVLHVVGYPETVAAIEECKERGQKYAMIQYCLRTTQRSNCADWLELWKNAQVVWSYYDLLMLACEDCAPLRGVNFYHAPLGVDPELFRPWDVPKRFAIGTSGYVADSECLDEISRATWALKEHQFHLGPPNLNLGEHVVCRLDVSDYTLAQMYSACHYVAGLRRIEGFELPAAEGLLCGARPILFDRPHYRQWYGDSAVYIPEGSPEDVTASVTAVLAQAPAPVTADERARAREVFSWPAIIEGLWASLERPVVTLAPARKRVLYVGDACVSSGFARNTHAFVESLRSAYDVAVLGLNYMGDPHSYPYPVFPCHTLYHPGDYFGVNRLPVLIDQWKPDAVVLQNDPWNIPAYFNAMKAADVSVPVVGVIAVDGKNCRGNDLNDLAVAVFWTKFAEKEAVFGGFKGQSFVIGLGVDLDLYKPMDRAEARKLLKLPDAFRDAFIVGNVNRNQPRKRLDLTIAYFCEWVKDYGIDDASLFLHVAPTGDQGYDVIQLMAGYYGLGKRLILAQPDLGQGVTEKEMVATYNAFDVQITTTQGEGWGLTTMEGMACGIPQIVPDWAALGEWPEGAVVKVSCSTQIATANYINSIGGVPDKSATIEALDMLYRDSATREFYRARGMIHVARPEYRWSQVGAEFADVMRALFDALDKQKEVREVEVVSA